MGRAVAIFENSADALRDTRRALESSAKFKCVLGSSKATDATAQLEGIKVDLVILDVESRDRRGISILGQICRSRPQVPVLVHTRVDSPEEVVLSLLMGASGYVVKGDGDVGLATATTVVAEGGAILSPRIARLIRQRAWPHEDLAWVFTLSPSELSVLNQLCHGLTAMETAAKRGTSTGTIHKHCEAIRRKASLGSIRQVVLQVGNWVPWIHAFRPLWGASTIRRSERGRVGLSPRPK